jgi:hypothetical protein
VPLSNSQRESLRQRLERAEDDQLMRIAQAPEAEYAPEARIIACEQLQLRGIPTEGEPAHERLEPAVSNQRQGLWSKISDAWDVIDCLVIVIVLLALLFAGAVGAIRYLISLF